MVDLPAIMVFMIIDIRYRMCRISMFYIHVKTQKHNTHYMTDIIVLPVAM